MVESRDRQARNNFGYDGMVGTRQRQHITLKLSGGTKQKTLRNVQRRCLARSDLFKRIESDSQRAATVSQIGNRGNVLCVDDVIVIVKRVRSDQSELIGNVKPSIRPKSTGHRIVKAAVQVSRLE